MIGIKAWPFGLNDQDPVDDLNYRDPYTEDEIAAMAPEWSAGYDEGWDDGFNKGKEYEGGKIVLIYCLIGAIGFVWGVFLTLFLAIGHGAYGWL